jgi:ferredoxin/flavodoxin---NADP+ reductase
VARGSLCPFFPAVCLWSPGRFETDHVAVPSRFHVSSAERLAPDVSRLIVAAPHVAAYARPGQFVIVRVDERGERIPLTISQHDPTTGTVTLVIQAVGRTTILLAGLQPGDDIADILGPLGRPSRIAHYGQCVIIGGGVGTAIALPVARALADAGNAVHGVVGARDLAHLILLDEMTGACNELTVTTDDGSFGQKGTVTDVLGEMLEVGVPDYVFAVGPVAMMSAVADITRPLRIPTVASLNPIMVDGTGMCGGCRVRVDGETRFACIDGPEFDAHQVDFDLLAARNRAYEVFESCRMFDAGKTS